MTHVSVCWKTCTNGFTYYALFHAGDLPLGYHWHERDEETLSIILYRRYEDRGRRNWRTYSTQSWTEWQWEVRKRRSEQSCG